ncbi:MAG TPA: redox-regulated ATPase YchF [Deltaproteobacteria bacterium]|nr:redox-regulated ATPase YchF [Deltaproteobacteria bacterium]
MKLGIIGLPQAGKSTIFAALTGARGAAADRGSRTDTRLATVTVLDERIDFLSDIYKPKKTTYARIEYLLPPGVGTSSGSGSEGIFWNQIRTCDALLHVVRNFEGTVGTPPAPEEDFRRIEEEMILSDLVVAEKRVERLELDRKRGKKPSEEEASLINSCCQVLGDGRPLRESPGLASHPLLRGFTFLSAKPMFVILNNDDEDEELPEWKDIPQGVDLLAVRGRLEMDIATMTPEEAQEFLEAYHIQESALDRVIRLSYRILNRISFFTVGADEVRAWPITAGTPALEAAGEVHSDIQQGFIRAETLSFEDLRTHGSFKEAKKAGLVRLEGKEYVVRDGDIINFRFNV